MHVTPRSHSKGNGRVLPAFTQPAAGESCHVTATSLPRHYHVTATSLSRHYHVTATSLPRHSPSASFDRGAAKAHSLPPAPFDVGGAALRGGVTGEDYCGICWVEDLESAPCILLSCGHIFHYECVRAKLRARWPGARISFDFMQASHDMSLPRH